MQLIAMDPASRTVGLIVLVCLGLAGLGWGYATYLTPHGLCVGEVVNELVGREFALVPERASGAAERLCNRAQDHSLHALQLIAGRH